MEIRITNRKYSISIEDESDINDTLDGIVAALQLEGFMVETIYKGLLGKAESMGNEFNFKEE